MYIPPWLQFSTSDSSTFDTITVKITRIGSGRDPLIVGPGHIRYPENGTWPLARYHASNANTDPYQGTIGLNITVQPRSAGESRDGDFFRINDEGILLFEQPPDYEEPRDEDDNNTYSFSITAYEANPPGRSQSHQTFFNVTVTVVNVGESLEILGPSVIDYPENSTDAVHTYTVSGSDGAVTWSPPSGTDGDHFSINDGVLAFLSPPDYEDPSDLDGGGQHRDQPDNGYLVAITVEDGTNIKTEHVKVRVTNVNEKPEFDEGERTTREVAADAALRSHVGAEVTATDPDDGDYPSYSLPDDATLPFTISAHTGQLSVDGTIDSSKESYTVVVLVTDGKDDDDNHEVDPATDDRITVTVNVTGGGGSNNAPVFPAGALSFSIDENTDTVETVGTPVAAMDGDSDTLSYSLDATSGRSFDINSSTGQISTKTGVTYDHETTPSYSVTVTADDSNGGTATKSVTITVTNVEEAGTVTFSPDPALGPQPDHGQRDRPRRQRYRYKLAVGPLQYSERHL